LKVKPPKPPAKAEAVKLWHRIRDFERQTRQPGRQDGAVTRNGLAVAHALIFDFMNFRTGQLDPGYGSIAEKACISIRSVARGLQALRQIGVLAWVRRCVEVMRDGRYSLEQDTNIYQLQPVTAWRGYTGPQDAPPPEAGTWGDHPCGTRDALAEAVQETSMAGMLHQLEADPLDRLAASLASLGRSLFGDSSRNSPECQPVKETVLSHHITGDPQQMT
jgi:hypothetical protein